MREQEAKERSQTAFDRQAATYDDDIKGRHARTLYPAVMERLARLRFDTVLDMGCGTGAVLDLITRRDPNVRAFGIDLSERMVQRATDKLAGRAEITLGDAEHLPFEDGSFDAVCCNDSFHHYPAPQRAIDEVHRVLRDGGTFILSDTWAPGVQRRIINLFIRRSFEGDVHLYSERDIRDLLESGFDDVEWSRPVRNAFLASGRKRGRRQNRGSCDKRS